jgi:hypothetical protein
MSPRKQRQLTSSSDRESAVVVESAVDATM